MWIDQNGNTWYRGNLHMHTQVSDGDLPFEEAVALYRKAGYDFLAVTDHWKWCEEHREEDFLLLPNILTYIRFDNLNETENKP